MTRKTQVDRRRGAALILVLVAITVAGGIVATLVSGLVDVLRQSEHLDARAQAAVWAVDLLDRAERAAARDPAYPGETVKITSADWTQDYSARGEITVNRESGSMTVTVVCPCDRTPFHRLTRTRPFRPVEDQS
ncbi:MAG: hypothetical protein AAGJ97_14520 [Planctomycetota bacterium]